MKQAKKQVKQIPLFGKRLKNIRRERGYTQAQLAELTGISRRAIVHYETQVKRPPLEKVKKIAEVLKISVDVLLDVSTPSKKQRKTEKASYRVMKKVRLIEKLPKRDQDMIFTLINTLVEKNKLKDKL